MANTIIPVDDVAKESLKISEETMSKVYPNLVKGTPEYNETHKELIYYSFGGLFYGN